MQTDYTYDVHGRLTKVSRPGSTTDYTYDNAQNRTNVKTTAANSAPVAYADTLTVNAGSAQSINPLSNDTDADSDPIVLTGVSGWNTSKGSVTFTPNCAKTATSCVTYSAVSGQASGTDSFSYAISDGKGGTASGTVNVTINASVAAPVATASTTTVTGNYAGIANSYPLTLNITGGTPTSLAINTPPPASAGTASVSGNTITFTPASVYSGQTSLQYTASNGGGSSSATATINVKPVVSSVSGTATTGSETTLALNPRTNYTSLSIPAGSGPQYGSAYISGSSVKYTPSTNAPVGSTDTFSYVANSAGGTSAAANISFNITQGNRAPVANDQFTDELDQSTTATLYPLANDSDPDGDSFTLQSVGPLEFVYGNNGTPSSLGTLTKNGDTVSYTAPYVCNCAARSKYHVIRFPYTIVDSKGLTSTAKHAMAVYSNQNPVAVNGSTEVSQSVNTTINPLANDSDPDGHTVSLKSIDNFYFAYGKINGVDLDGAHPPADIGSVTKNGNTITYRSPFVTNSGAYHSSYVVVVVWYTISDGHGGTSQAYEVIVTYAPG